MTAADLPRCHWAGTDPLMRAHHDDEWGVPVHDDRVHFEFLVLEGAQAGLSWQTILNKRVHYREVLDGFDPARIARYDARRRAKLMRDAGIVRNRLKIESLATNARAFLAIQEEFGSYDGYVWRFVDGKPVVTSRRRWTDVPPRTVESDALSTDLKRRGLTFVGTTIIYAYMQATGLVNDHLTTCFRCRPLGGAAA